MIESENQDTGSFLTEGGGSRHTSFWVVYLYVRPRRFFEHFHRTVTGFSTLYSSLVVGLAYAIDRFSTKIVQYQLTGRPQIPEVLLESWAAYWMFCIVLGCLSAAMYYAIGGWWYRVRLGWAGAAEPDKRVARQVYIFATLIAALPCVIITAIDSLRFSTPMEAEVRGGAAWIVVVALVFYSVYVSYRGVRTVFDTVRWKAVLWFLMLPWLVYMFVFAAAIAIGVGAMLSSDGDGPSLTDVAERLIDTPDERRAKDIAEIEELLEKLDEYDSAPDPAKFEAVEYDFAPFRVETPEWWFPEGLGDVDRSEFEVQFSLMGRGASVELQFRRLSGADADHTSATVRYFTKDHMDRPAREFSTWGRYRGAGIELPDPTASSPGTLRVFTTHTEKYRVTIIERWLADGAEWSGPGLELIQRTFTLKN